MGSKAVSIVSMLMRLFPIVLVALSFAAQDRSADSRAFVGHWKAVCADGKEFVLLDLVANGTGIGGTISLGNTGGEEGQCAYVVNPPNPQHAMKITDAAVKESTLHFRGAGRMDFEMRLKNNDQAELKFMGTPVEDHPWVLRRAK